MGGHFVVVVVLILGRKVSHYEDAIGIFISVPSWFELVCKNLAKYYVTLLLNNCFVFQVGVYRGPQAMENNFRTLGTSLVVKVMKKGF